MTAMKVIFERGKPWTDVLRSAIRRIVAKHPAKGNGYFAEATYDAWRRDQPLTTIYYYIPHLGDHGTYFVNDLVRRELARKSVRHRAQGINPRSKQWKSSAGSW